MNPARLPLWAPLALIAIALGLGALTVWERSAVLHLGSEVLSLRAEAARLKEEDRSLRMALSRLASPGRLAAWRGSSKEPWVSEGARTREVVQRVQESRRGKVAELRR
jgi:hypothetical protein